MKYAEVQKLKQGDKVKDRCLGYIMTVQSMEETKEYDGWKERKYIFLNCIAENGKKIRVEYRYADLLK